jgi:hypothetical protein
LLTIRAVRYRPAVTETTPAQTTGDTPGRAAVAGVIALAGHAVTLLAAYVAARAVQPSSGGGFEDLAAAVVTFLGTQILLGLGCLIIGLRAFVKGRRYTGLGLVGGWLAGLIVAIALTNIL